MIGGIDQQIQQKVDAYRGNPQQLMQRYQQNQELIDLLALQKLKSEKDAAAREMQMQMQTTPQTIKQQREAELLQMTKDDMVKQTSGIMQERQKRQQQNMQRTANQGLPQLPAGNMQRMAGGGIVAFAEGGGPLRQEDVDAKLKQEIELALQLGESPEALAERLKDNPNALAILRSAIQKAPERRAGSMGERPAEARDLPRIDTKSPSAPVDRGPMMDLQSDTALAMLLGGQEPRRPEEPSEPMLGMPTRDQARQADQSRLERIRGNLSPSLGSIDTEQLVRGMGVTPLSEKPDAVTSAARPVPERKPTTPDRFGGVGLFGGERAPVTTTPREGGGIGEILRQMQESAAKTPGGPVSEAVQTNRGLRGEEGLGGLYEETKPAPAPPAPTQTPAQAPAEVEQLEEIDLSKIPERKKLPAEPTPSSRYEDLRTRLEKTLEEQQDPDKLLRERQIAFKLGALANQGRGGLAGAAAARERAREVQEGRELKGIGSLMGADLETMKLDIDREANQALQQLRQGQMDIQKFNAVASSFQDLQNRINDELSMNPEYRNAQTAYADALDDGDREAMKRALQRIDEIRNRVIRGMPNYLTLQDTLKKMSARFAGAEGDTTTAPIDLTQYSVREKPQQ